jgi:hypothetical protein
LQLETKKERVLLHAKDVKVYPVSVLCRLSGVTKQAYYQYNEEAALSAVARGEFVLQYIRSIRRKDPGMGGMKLWYMHRKTFGGSHPVGRDRFGDIVDK